MIPTWKSPTLNDPTDCGCSRGHMDGHPGCSYPAALQRIAALEKRLADRDVHRARQDEASGREIGNLYAKLDELEKILAESEASAAAMREALEKVFTLDCALVDGEADPWAFDEGIPCIGAVRKALSSTAGTDFEARVWNAAVDKCTDVVMNTETNHELSYDHYGLLKETMLKLKR